MKKSEICEELRYWLNYMTPIEKITISGKRVYIKREDFIPFSFGGNKVRIAASYLLDAVEKDSDVIVTYGASSSNLCRVIANMAYKYGIKCIIVSPQEDYHETPNSKMVEAMLAEIVKTPIDCVSKTIESVLEKNKVQHSPYFIYGGGHGFLGSQAYRPVMKQICQCEREIGVVFSKIYITLATGTSMSGLIIENEECNYGKYITGISVARSKERATEVMKESLNTYRAGCERWFDDSKYKIVDDYINGGYGKFGKEIVDTVQNVFFQYGINLDTTYTGKAFYGVMKEIEKEDDVLFIHTGGTPLFFKENCNILLER